MGNVNPARQPPTTAAGSTSGSSSAPRPAAKRRLETGTVSLEFLLGGGGSLVNLDVHEDFAFCSSEAPGAPHAAQTSVPASEPRSRPARSAVELLALYGPGVGVAPPAPKRRRATGTVSFEFLPGGGGLI